MDDDAALRPILVDGDRSRDELLGEEIGKSLGVPTISDELRDRRGRYAAILCRGIAL